MSWTTHYFDRRLNADAISRAHATKEGALRNACDLMLQPYADGVSTRRTSLMAALAHRSAVVTTDGVLTEPLWRQSGAVALVDSGDLAAMRATLTHLMDDPARRARMGAAAGALYAERFDVAHTIAALREGC